MTDKIPDSIAEAARMDVFFNVRAKIDETRDLEGVRHSILMGAFAAACELWCAEADADVTRERLKEALRGMVDDFVDQALDNQLGPIQ